VPHKVYLTSSMGFSTSLCSDLKIIVPRSVSFRVAVTLATFARPRFFLSPVQPFERAHEFVRPGFESLHQVRLVSDPSEGIFPKRASPPLLIPTRGCGWFFAPLEPTRSFPPHNHFFSPQCLGSDTSEPTSLPLPPPPRTVSSSESLAQQTSRVLLLF